MFSMAVLGLPAAACTIWAVIATVDGAWLTTLVSLACAVFLGAAASTWGVMATATPFATANETGTIIRPDRRIDRLMLVCLIASIPGMGGLGLFGALGWLKLPLPADIERMWSLPFAAPALVSVVALWMMMRRGGMAYVRLTPTGFEFAERFSTRSGEWSTVVAVSNVAPDLPKASSPLVIRMADGSKVWLMESALFGPRDALFTLVDFLWRNPAARAELVDGRAISRLLAI
jgi:hypothetical protein